MSKNIYLKCLLLIAIGLPAKVTGLHAQLRCKLLHYSTEDGLSHERVTCIVKDSEGFMWFGTWDGLNRFDGHNFITYKSYTGDKSGLKNNRIDGMVDDNAGYLWITAYDKQIYRFNKQTGEFLSVDALVNDSKIDKYMFDKVVPMPDNSIWLTTKNQGIFNLIGHGDHGFTLRRFSSHEPDRQKLPADKINFFYRDHEGQLWVGTPQGIACIARQGKTFFVKQLNSLQHTNRFNYLSAAEDERHHRLYFTADNGYLAIYDDVTGKCQTRKVANNASLNNICVSRRKNVIYCSTSQGALLTVDAADGAVLKTTQADQESVLSIYEDSRGLVWIEPLKHGIIKYDPRTGQVKHFIQQDDSNFDNGPAYYRVFEDKDGNVWANMKSYGFGYYDAKKDVIDYFHNAPNIRNHYFSNIVNCQYYDPAGILWLSTDDRGLDKVIFQDNDFHQKILVENSAIKSDNEVRAIYQDHENRMWVATKQGKLYVTKDKKPVTGLFDTEPSDSNIGQVYTILEDHDGTIWIGTKATGLYRANPVDQRRQHYKLTHYLPNKNNKEGLSSNVIYSLQEDTKGRIWAATYDDGLVMISKEGGQLHFYTLKNAFKNYPKSLHHKVRDLALDARGNLWAATVDGLLVANINTDDMARLRFKSFNKVPGDSASLGNNDVQFIFRDSRNTMWLATSGGGLSEAIGTDPFKKLSFHTFTIKDGLPSDYILDCCEDNSRNLWLATQKGISEFDATRKHFKNFDSYDGLPKNGFSEASCLKLPDGNLIFGAISGYVCFNPDSIVDHKIRANMALTGFLVNDKSITGANGDGTTLNVDINHTAAVTLNYDQNLVDISYSMLDYRSSNKNMYAYRLKGFDTGWTIDNKNLRRATYSHLPPGKYVFEVKSLNDNLYFHTPVKSVKLTILPPPWATWWAYLIYAIIAGVLVEGIRRTTLTVLRLRERISVEKRLTELKFSFFTNISHELRTPLTLILNPIEEIFRKEKLSAKGKEHARIIQKNAGRMVSFINQLLDLRKMENGKASLQVSPVEIISFVRNIGDFFAQLAVEKQISLKIISKQTELFAWVDAEKLDTVVYNLLANAFKFSGNGTAITIMIDQDLANRQFSIHISDQGPGVPANKLTDIFELYYEGEQMPDNQLKGTGIGLALSREIVELHLGKIYAVNNTDRGLSVIIQLNLGEDYINNTTAIFADPFEKSCASKRPIEELANQPLAAPDNQGDLNLPLILLVEDNYDLRKFLAAQLSDYYRVAEAENGCLGWEQVINLQPNLVISDVMMPEMDGIQLLDKLKNHNETSHIPVILLSARSAIENQIQGLRYGADYYITKPFSNDMILTLIDNFIRQRKQLLENLMNRQKTVELSPGQVIITSKDEGFLRKIIEIVDDGMTDPDFNIETVAESIGMSRSAFYKKFKSLTNVTPVEFVRDMRLKRSLQFLDGGESDIAHIAYAIGFSDPKYFSVCFKKQYDVSPSEYLKSKKLKVQPTL